MFFPVLFGGGAVPATVALWASTIIGYVYAFYISNSGFGAQVTATGGSGLPSGPTLAAVFSKNNDYWIWSGGSSVQGGAAFSDFSGFGPAVSNPSPLAVGDLGCAVFDSQNTFVAFTCRTNSPFLFPYVWNAGFGAQLAQPATAIPTGLQKCNWSYNGEYFVACLDASPWVIAYAFDPNSGFGAKFSDPGTASQTNTLEPIFNLADEAIAIASTTTVSPVYHWSASGWGSRYTAPATPINEGQVSVKFNINQTVLGFSGKNSAPLAYAWDNTSGWGSPYSQPSAAWGSNVFYVDFASQNSLFVVGLNASSFPNPSVVMFPWSDSTGFGAKFADMSPAIQGAAFQVQFNGRFKGTQ